MCSHLDFSFENVGGTYLCLGSVELVGCVGARIVSDFSELICLKFELTSIRITDCSFNSSKGIHTFSKKCVSL